MKKIFKQSVDLLVKEHDRKEVKEVRVDITVREKNITFPTDRKLTEKVINHFKRISRKEGITLKATDTSEILELKHQLRFARKPKNLRKHIKAQKKLHGIAFKLYRDLVSQLNPIPMSNKEESDVLYRVLILQRDDKNMIYSIHEPEVLCISKGEEHR